MALTPSPSDTEQLPVRPGEQINEAQGDEKRHQMKSGLSGMSLLRQGPVLLTLMSAPTSTTSWGMSGKNPDNLCFHHSLIGNFVFCSQSWTNDQLSVQFQMNVKVKSCQFLPLSLSSELFCQVIMEDWEFTGTGCSNQ